jgi:vancomycin resistance protein VanJ
MFSFFQNKKARLKFFYGLTILMALSLLLGCVFVLTGSNIFAFTFSICFPILASLNMFILLFWLINKNKILFAPLFGIIVFFLCFNSFIQFNAGAEKSSKESISVLTYNVHGFITKNGVSYNNRGDKILDFIEKQDAGIISFQEFSHFRIKNFIKYPYHFLGYRDSIAKSVQIILSKYPIVNNGYVDFPNTRNNAMFADIAFKEEIIRVYNVHLQSFWVEINGGKSHVNRRTEPFKTISMAQKMRIEQVQMIEEHSKNFMGPIIICGDFNSTQFSSTYKSLKEGRKDTFVEAGFGLGTTYNLLSRYPLRLDYILVDDSFDVVSHQNFDLKLSDHEPIFVELVKN